MIDKNTTVHPFYVDRKDGLPGFVSAGMTMLSYMTIMYLSSAISKYGPGSTKIDMQKMAYDAMKQAKITIDVLNENS